EPLPCNPGVVENHPHVSHSETIAPAISATVVPPPDRLRATSSIGGSMSSCTHCPRVSSLTIRRTTGWRRLLMGSFVRSYLTIGVATVTAATIAFVPSVKEPAAVASYPRVVQVASPPIKLAALVQPSVTATNLPDLVFEWLQRITVPPSAGATFPTPQLPPVVVGNSVSSFIKNTYNAVEPWVQWGFEVAAYALGWVPYVGWLAPQINIFYNFGEQIVRSITFNVADWIGGQISFVQGLSNVGVDTVNAFIYLA